MRPIQPLAKDAHGRTRFVRNAIVTYLLDIADGQGLGLNHIATMGFPPEDRAQFAQLIGYSLDGFAELSYVDDDTYRAAVAMADGKSELQARVETLQNELDALRTALREPMARLFGVHPSELE